MREMGCGRDRGSGFERSGGCLLSFGDPSTCVYTCLFTANASEESVNGKHAANDCRCFEPESTRVPAFVYKLKRSDVLRKEA
jgi:hypothetical protein